MSDNDERIAEVFATAYRLGMDHGRMDGYSAGYEDGLRDTDGPQEALGRLDEAIVRHVDAVAREGVTPLHDAMNLPNSGNITAFLGRSRR